MEGEQIKINPLMRFRAIRVFSFIKVGIFAAVSIWIPILFYNDAYIFAGVATSAMLVVMAFMWNNSDDLDRLAQRIKEQQKQQ